MPFGLIEQIAYATGTYTYEHLYKLRTGNGKERYARFTGNCFCQQGFPRTGGADEQYTFRYTCPKLNELLRLFQELDYFGQLLLRFLHTGDIIECNSWMFTAEHASTRFTKRH